MSRYRTAFVLTALLGGLLAFAPQAGAAKPAPEAPIPLDTAPVERADPLVERIQQGLADIGLYLGPINGVMNRETEASIRAYQKRSGFTVDSKATEELAQQLEMGTKVQMLLQRLDQVRAENIRAARSALMSAPATRGLLEKPIDDRADPTRDPTPCFRAPTPACLLAEASETAKTIAKPDMRDWARGELLVAQAKAGLTDEAMDTVRRIGDPRLILVALRDLAEAQARAGRGAEALAATDIIPDRLKRAEALAAVAERQSGEDARRTVDRLLGLADELGDPLKRISFQSRAAVALARSGAPDRARNLIAKAEKAARARKEDAARGLALRHVAIALADMDEPIRAEDLAGAIAEPSDQVPVLMAASRWYAGRGDFDKALALAERIAEDRYRTVALCRVSEALARKGETEEAENILARADEAAKTVRLPYARDFATSHMALALAAIARQGTDKDGFARAVEHAKRINDDRLRSHTLWTVAARQDAAGDKEGSETTRHEARDAGIDIKSPLTRAWMYGDLAVERAESGESRLAAEAFRRGLDETTAIENAWARARALAKMADSLIELGARNVAVPAREPPQ